MRHGFCHCGRVDTCPVGCGDSRSTPVQEHSTCAMTPTLVFREQTLTPEAFFDRVMRAAQVLHTAGLGAGDVLALLMRNSPQMLELMLAARWLGAMWCPINWHFKTDEVQYILDDSGARVFVVDDDLLHELPGLQLDGDSQASCTARTVHPTRPPHRPGRTGSTARDAAAELRRRRRCRPAAPCSTPRARPAGPRASAVRRPAPSRWRAARPCCARCWVSSRACAHWSMRRCTTARPTPTASARRWRTRLLFIEQRFDAEHTLRLIAQHRITHAYLVPTMYVRMLALPPAVRARYDLRSIRSSPRPALRVRRRSSAP